MTSDRTPSPKERKQILEEHRQITERNPKIRDLGELSERLSVLEPLLERRFRREEEQNGLHEDIRTRSPRLLGGLSQLVGEHRELLQMVALLRARIRESPERSLEAIQAQWREFLEQLSDHEARETELFLDSILTDVGGGD